MKKNKLQLNFMMLAATTVIVVAGFIILTSIKSPSTNNYAQVQGASIQRESLNDLQKQINTVSDDSGKSEILRLKKEASGL